LRTIFSILKTYIAPFFAVAIAIAIAIAIAVAIAIAIAATMYFGAAVDKLHALIHTNPEPGHYSPFRPEVKSLNQKLAQLSSNQSKLDPIDDDADIVLPLPRDRVRNEYTKSEAVQILSQTKKGSGLRGNTMRQMVSLGYAPVHRRVLQKLMQRNDQGETIPNVLWNSNKPIQSSTLDQKAKQSLLPDKSKIANMVSETLASIPESDISQDSTLVEMSGIMRLQKLSVINVGKSKVFVACVNCPGHRVCGKRTYNIPLCQPCQKKKKNQKKAMGRR
jgi:hypothetical protein